MGRGMRAIEAFGPEYGPQEVVLTLSGCPPREADQRAISMFYTNHRGEKRRRHVIPFDFVYGVAHPWYQEPQWLMVAWDRVKAAWRIFALDNVSGWNPEDSETAPSHDEGHRD
jgi:predicted DNA-binding transcriptional regulator YafY